MPEIALPCDKGWTRLGPGGGGSMFSPTASPHDPNTAIVTCDMTGQYVTRDGGRSWRMTNLMIHVDTFAFDPVDANRIYAGANALFATDDFGESWRMLWPGPDAPRETALVGDEASAIYSGGNWPQRRIAALAIDLIDNKRIYAGLSSGRRSAEGESEVYLSEDRGASWRRLSALPGARVHRLAVNHYAPRHLWAITAAGVYWSDDAGARWAKVARENDHPVVSGDTGFEEDGRVRLYVNAAAPANCEDAHSGLSVSEDGGESWLFVGAGVQLHSDVRGYGGVPVKAVACCRDHPGIAYLATSASHPGNGKPVRELGVAKTGDGGRTWEWVFRASNRREVDEYDDDWSGERHEPDNYVEMDWLTRAYGSFWCDFPFGFGVCGTNPDYCYATDMGRGYMTADGGKTWRSIIDHPDGGGGSYTSGLDITTCYGVHFDPHDANVAFISYTDIGLFKSLNRGRSWHHRINGVPRPWINTCYWLVFDPEVPGKLWSVWSNGHDYPRVKMYRGGKASRYRGGVCVSEDNGKTWRATMEGMPEVGCTQLVLDPRSPAGKRTLYVVAHGRGVYKSTDDGATWELRNVGLPAENLNAWWLAGEPGAAMYLLITRDLDGNGESVAGGIFRTTDGAEHWERLPVSEEIPFPNDLCLAPDDPKTMYAAAWSVRLGDRVVEGGVFKTADGGATWEKLPFIGKYVYAVTIDPREPGVLYATAWHHGVFRSEDGGRTWTRLGGANFAWPHRIIPDPFDRERVYLTTFGGSVWHGPKIGTAGAGPDIADLPEVVAIRP
jgi:photosystem II stability/assembly factor-like uncharacterized protein